MVFFNRAEWEVIREMSLAGSGLVLSPPPLYPRIRHLLNLGLELPPPPRPRGPGPGPGARLVPGPRPGGPRGLGPGPGVGGVGTIPIPDSVSDILINY